MYIFYPMQSSKSTYIQFLSWIHCCGEVWLIHLYVIKYVSCLWQDGGFEQLFWFPSPMKK